MTSAESKEPVRWVSLPSDSGSRLGEEFLRSLFNGMTPFTTCLDVVIQAGAERFPGGQPVNTTRDKALDEAAELLEGIAAGLKMGPLDSPMSMVDAIVYAQLIRASQSIKALKEPQ